MKARLFLKKKEKAHCFVVNNCHALTVYHMEMVIIKKIP
jgi:hypothetical protein